jgi:hypothetical protein
MMIAGKCEKSSLSLALLCLLVLSRDRYAFCHLMLFNPSDAKSVTTDALGVLIVVVVVVAAVRSSPTLMKCCRQGRCRSSS